MKIQSTIVLLIILSALSMPISAEAHHSISAEFDSTKPITLSGIVTNVDWMNPHTYVFVDVKDTDAGTTRTWACELASPTELARRGFTRGSLRVGMTIRVVGTRAKDGSFRIHTDTLTADNSVLFSK